MDSNRLSVQHHNGGVSKSKPPVHHHHHHGSRRCGKPQQGAGGKGIKVVYISSPVMLTASAEEFRAVVQELTGRDSNVADLAHVAGAPPFSSSSSSYSSSFGFGRASGPTTAATTDARALPQTRAMATATTAGPGRPAEYAVGLAAPPPFQFQGTYDQTGSLLYGRQDYW